MIILSSFHVTSPEDERDFFDPMKKHVFKTKTYRTCYQSVYPFKFFEFRGLPDPLTFDDITIFSGNNGCGKSTLLNVIAEKLHLKRNTPYNRSDFFDDYTELCQYELADVLIDDSSIITSDDVFNRVLDIRRLNNGIDDKRNMLIQEYINTQKFGDRTFHGMEDYDRWKEVHNTVHSSQSQFIRSKLVNNVEEHSNGESALAYFIESIKDGGLYLLDEPENSLSPSNQILFKSFIEDCVKYNRCQFVLSTHSPFLLSLRHAKIYDLESDPVSVVRWSDLESVRAYYDFFRERAAEFGDRG